jgi:hypothetical protein
MGGRSCAAEFARALYGCERICSTTCLIDAKTWLILLDFLRSVGNGMLSWPVNPEGRLKFELLHA